MDIFEIKNFSFAYPDENSDREKSYLKDCLKNININIQKGEFVVLIGPSGCGKTTLLRHLKKSMIPEGRIAGQVNFCGKNVRNMEDREATAAIGFVMQDVDGQLVTDKVWHELAFGLESLGYSNEYIRGRVAEVCSFFGLSDIFHREVRKLSGGQKQLVNLAAVMTMSPEVLILDEPTSQLDPIAAREFIASLHRINSELGTTIIMTEHRVEDVIPLCSRLVAMENGNIVADGEPEYVAEKLAAERGHRGIYMSMPTVLRMYIGLSADRSGLIDKAPVDVAEGRGWLENYDREYRQRAAGGSENVQSRASDRGEVSTADGQTNVNDKVLSLRDVYFKYDRGGQDVLRGFTLDVNRGEILMINGGNGSGKSTLLGIIAGINKPYSGKIKRYDCGQISMLPQNPQTLFSEKTVMRELCFAKDKEQLRDITDFCGLGELLDRHPYDLSGGEQQRLALAKVLISQPDVLLMDEPTKGLDNQFKKQLADMLINLKEKGKTIILVSHDIEFCGQCADEIALLFDGEISKISTKRAYMSENDFFTTTANRLARGILEDVVTVEDIFKAYGVVAGDNDEEDDKDNRGGNQAGTQGGNQGGSRGDTQGGNQGGNRGDTQEENSGDNYEDLEKNEKYNVAELDPEKRRVKLSWWRKLIMSLSAVVIALCFYVTMSQKNLTNMVVGSHVTEAGYKSLAVYAVFIVAVVVFLVALSPIAKSRNEKILLDSRKKATSKKTVLVSIICGLGIVFAIWFGFARLSDKKYLFISLVVLLLAMLPFFLSFEERKPKARDVVTVAVMCALAVTGRVAFSMLPNFSPVVAIVVISGVAFGCQGGFIVGAVTMLASNFIMGQGPWTPWQMFAMGMVGFFSGLVFKGTNVRRKNLTKLGLTIFGALLCIVVYGAIMNPASVLMWQGYVNLEMIAVSYITGFPFDLAQATATVAFLWIMARPFLEKLDRLRIKYGII